MGVRHHTIVVGLLGTLLSGVMIAGCAQGTGTPTPGGSSVSSPPASSGQSPGAPSSPPASGEASAQPTEMTLSGQVEQGVEANCLIMRSDGRLYELRGGDKNIVKAGNKVVVRGRIVTGTMSYCMQGQPFQVTEARMG